MALETQNFKHREYRWAETSLRRWADKGSALSCLQKHPG